MVDDRFKIIFEQNEDGSFIASYPELPDCQAKGDTYLLALQNIKKMIVKRLKEVKDKD